MSITSSGKVVVTQVKNGGLQTEHYETLEDLIVGILMTSGVRLVRKVINDVMPNIQEEWKDELDEDYDDMNAQRE